MSDPGMEAPHRRVRWYVKVVPRGNTRRALALLEQTVVNVRKYKTLRSAGGQRHPLRSLRKEKGAST